MAKIPGLGGIGRAESGAKDIAGRLDRLYAFENAASLAVKEFDDIEQAVTRISAVSEKWGATMGGIARAGRDMKKSQQATRDAIVRANNDLAQQKRIMDRMVAVGSTSGHLWQKTQETIEECENRLRALNEEMTELNKKTAKLPGGFRTVAQLIGGDILKAADKLGKTMVMGGIGVFAAGVYELEKALKNVHELFERWTGAMGKFRLGMGAAGATVDKWTSSANALEGQMRGLTGTFGLSHDELQTFVKTFGFADDRAASFAKNAVLMGRAMGIGTEGAAALQKNLALMGEQVGSDTDLFGKIVSGANAAGVSVADFGKEIVSSKDFLAAFGRTGKTVFIEAAAYARRLGLSLRSLEAFTKGTDNFDATVEGMAKINTVFGTSLNALSMVLEEDPSKRLEEIRKQLKDQNKDLESMSRREKMLLAETLHISQEELNGVIATGETLEQFQLKQEKAQKSRRQNEDMMQKALAKTAQTLYAFSLGWDEITMAVVKLIHPFTDMLGLTSKMQTFGEVMGGIFHRVAEFITDIANNPNWQRFIHKMADEVHDMVTGLSNMAKGDGLATFVKTMTESAGKFYDTMKQAFELFKKAGTALAPTLKYLLENIDWIIKAWAGGKIAASIIGVMKAGKGVYDLYKKINAAKAAVTGAGAASGAAGAAGGGGGAAAGGMMSGVAGPLLLLAAGAYATTKGLDYLNAKYTDTGKELDIWKQKLAISSLAVSSAEARVKSGFEQIDLIASSANYLDTRFGLLAGTTKKLNDEIQERLEKEFGPELKERGFNEKRTKIDLDFAKANEDALKKALAETEPNWFSKFSVHVADLFGNDKAGRIEEKLADREYAQQQAELKTAKAQSAADQARLSNLETQSKFVGKYAKEFNAETAQARIDQGGVPVQTGPRKLTLPTMNIPTPKAGSAIPVGAKTTNFAKPPNVAGATASNAGFTAGDVYLDGEKVGRHVVRQMLSQESA